MLMTIIALVVVALALAILLSGASLHARALEDDLTLERSALAHAHDALADARAYGAEADRLLQGTFRELIAARNQIAGMLAAQEGLRNYIAAGGEVEVDDEGMIVPVGGMEAARELMFGKAKSEDDDDSFDLLAFLDQFLDDDDDVDDDDDDDGDLDDGFDDDDFDDDEEVDDDVHDEQPALVVTEQLVPEQVEAK